MNPPIDVRERFVALYEPLHAVARRYLDRERADHTLQPTALLHDAYLRIAPGGSTRCADERRFLAMAAVVMRRILVNHAKARASAKRGGGRVRVELSASACAVPGPSLDLIALDEALEKLRRLDERQHRVVELLFFGGLTIDRVAEVLGVGPTTVDEDWAMARAWLRRELAGRPS